MVDPPTLLRVLPPLEQSPDALAELAAACEKRTAPPGTLLMREGEAADTLVGVLAGEVDVLRRVGERQRTMVRLGPGTLLGETALVAELRRTASVRAHGEVRFVSLPAAAARQAMTHSPPLVLWLIERQMRRLQEREDSYLEALRQGIVARDKELAELRLTRPAATADDEGGVWSPSLEPVLDRARRLARADLPVLIGGEPGTGKELLARYVHQHSERRGRQLCSLNCAAIPAEIAEAEMFGARKGAFTGAERDRHGLFHEADGGTLFLDEIGELPLPVQAKLLRALQDGTYYALGSRQPQRADVRVVSATNKDLRKEAAEGRFREDLMYRIEGARLRLPPLRERPDHIPLLVRWVVGRAIPDAEPAHVTRDVMPALLRYRWPGNVRELIHVIKAAIALTETYPRLQPFHRTRAI